MDVIEPVETLLISEEIEAPSDDTTPSTKVSSLPLHPTYLLSQLFNIQNKKIIIGYSPGSFEVKICIVFEKKFIELSTAAFSSFFLNCEKIYRHHLKNQKSTFILEENDGHGKKLLKLTSKSNLTTANFEDTFRQVKIVFNEEELLLLVKSRFCLAYLLQSYLFNKNSVMSYYHLYVQNCISLGVKSLDNHGLMHASNEIKFFNIDSYQLFYSIPIVMPFQLERDIFFQSVAPSL